MKIRQLTITALLSALFFVLANLKVQAVAFKFTLEAFAVLIGALMYGPITGMTVGLLGSFLYQMLNYGMSLASILYCIPHGLSGLIVGLYAKSKNYQLTYRQTVVISTISALLVTGLNTVVIYLQSNWEGWYTAAYVFGTLPAKIIIGIILACIFSTIIPKIIKVVKK